MHHDVTHNGSSATHAGSSEQPDALPLETTASESVVSEELSEADAELSREELLAEVVALRSQVATLQKEQEENLETQANLLQSVQYYCDILESAVAGFFQSTPEGSYILVNGAIAHMLRYESSVEMMSQVQDIATQLYVDPSDRQRFLSSFETQDTVTGFEYQARCKDGRIIWLSEDARVVRDDTGASSTTKAVALMSPREKRLKQLSIRSIKS